MKTNEYSIIATGASAAPARRFPCLTHPLTFSLFSAMVAVIAILFHSQAWPFSRSGSKPALASISNIVGHLTFIARAPHPTGSQEHRAVLAYLTNQLASFGYTVEIQQEEVVRKLSDNYFFSGHVQNVMVRLQGDNSSGALLIAAHYDSTPVSHGAADDGYSVGSMLEVARLMALRPRPKHDVIFLFTDGEELGMVGAEAFLRHPWLKDVGMILNFDARGTHGPVILFESSRNNRELIRSVSQLGNRLVAVSLAEEVYRVMPNATDFTIFRQTGLPGLNFANIHEVAHYHTALDSTNNISVATVEHLFESMLALASHFSSSAPVSATEDAVFFDLAGLTFVSFPASWSIPLAAILTALFGVLVFLFSSRLSFIRIAIVVLLQLLAAALAAGAILGLMIAFRKVMASDISVSALYREPLYMGGLSLIIAALTFGLFGLAGRRLGGSNISMGVLFLWVVLTWLSVVWLVKGSYLFLFVTGCIEIALLGSILRHPLAARVMPILLTVPAIVLLATTIALLFVAGNISSAPFLAPLISLAFASVVIVPALENPRSLRMFSLLCAVAALLLLATGMLVNPPSNEHSRRYSLAYLGDADSQTGHLLSTDQQMLPWQRAHFPESAEREPLQNYLPWRRASVAVAVKDFLPLAAPQIPILSNGVSNGIRQVAIGLESHRDASSLYLVITCTNLLGLRANGSDLFLPATPPNLITIQFTGKLSATATLLLKEGSPCKVALFDQSHGLPEELKPRHGDATPSPTHNFSDSIFMRRSLELPSRDGEDQ